MGAVLNESFTLTDFKAAEGNLSDLTEVAPEILVCCRTYWRDLKLGAEVEADEPWQRATLPGCGLGYASEPDCRGRFRTQAGIAAWFHPFLISDWAPQNQRLGVYPRFKPKHRCCCNAIPAGAEAPGTGLGVGLRTHALLSMSHTRFTAEEGKRCFMLSGSGAECCSLPPAVLLLKTSQGLGMMGFHADIYIQELSVSSCACKGSISKL